ncbi:hypothetical protein Bbelb_119870 [Branchiostoma belcheri]|nr:hypothetical protein Bbelb_119870 [Branchiostoma belcheri]
MLVTTRVLYVDRPKFSPFELYLDNKGMDRPKFSPFELYLDNTGSQVSQVRGQVSLISAVCGLMKDGGHRFRGNYGNRGTVIGLHQDNMAANVVNGYRTAVITVQQSCAILTRWVAAGFKQTGPQYPQFQPLVEDPLLP